MRNKLCFIIIFLFSILSGCSNYKELNEIAIVVGLGIDYIPAKKTYQVIYQAINPSENAAQATGSGATPVTSFITTGKTLSEAAYNTSRLFSRQNIYSHIQVVILGEQLAKKESLNFIFDVFERDAGVRVNVPVLIARDENVKTTMDILPSNDKVPVRTIIGKLKNASKNTGEYGETKIYQVIEDLSNIGSEPAINGISINGDKEKGTTKANLENMHKAYVFLNGVAMFGKGKLVGWLDGKKTKSIQIIQNKIEQTNVRIHCDEKRYNNILVNRLKSHSNVDIKNNQAVITINANVSGSIVELLCNKDISNRKVVKEYEHKAERELEKEIKDGIKAAQKVKSDVFGFGEILHYTHIRKWNESKHRWKELFSQANVNVHVKMDIERTGMRIKPYPY
ncbi:Ger(x)C family spore germination protein [Neobacillus sp. PS3-34]|uniref:Ger(x)C family spore germination protein n=1 Tax=Neobacillus sp. PS3-34 TaxID=3070678 RepID=UPI0027E04339|nr:Ger(x)C family spore germination protein [Neobacillus sp. PS3-34]WML48991.1 Ger(x)C family spore germination protein [Neobacillus sp. PS3-34]